MKTSRVSTLGAQADAKTVDLGDDRLLVEKLHAATAHGDQEHRDWLLAAYKAFFAGKPVPAPRGSGRKEKLIREQADRIATLRGLLERIADIENGVGYDPAQALIEIAGIASAALSLEDRK